MYVYVLAVLLAIAGCHNESGTLTITNSYSGTCELSYSIADPYATERMPFAGGEPIVVTGLSPGLHTVGFSTSGTTMGRACTFTQAASSDYSCTVYVAGTFDATIAVTNEGALGMPGVLCGDPSNIGDYDLNIVEDTVTVTRGEVTSVTVEVTRRGYDGPIMVSFVAPTAGAELIGNPVTIPAGESSVMTTIGASMTAPYGELQLIASGTPFGPMSDATDATTIVVRGVGGGLDPTFAGDGTFVLEVGGVDSELHAATITFGDGVLAAGTSGGDWLVVKLLADGTPDPNFGMGGSGRVVIPFAGASDGATDITEMANGSIFVTGRAGTDFTVVKLTSTGAIDTSFDTDGIVTIDFGGETDVSTQIATQAAVVYVGGTAGTTNPDMAIAALDSTTGALSSFGSSGKLRVSRSGIEELDSMMYAFGSFGSYLYAIGTQRAQPSDPRTLVSLRTDSTGALDTSFGTAGIATGSTSASYGVVTGATVYLIDGALQYVHGGSYQVEQLTEPGMLDLTFGTGGTTAPLVAGAGARGVALVAAPLVNATLVTGGVGAPADTIVTRVTRAGVLDPSWSVGGTAIIPISIGPDQAEDVVVDYMGRYVVVGWAEVASGRRAIMAARLLSQ